ncbi:retrotransposon-like protein 1 [Canis lupus baileyi]|uniref:Retrotransposon Gag like 1 n=2 Tax=Canis lupus familiaris TaxID=9615 RepID=A0A8P0SM52_CANLF|nr:retrotransposon-like protein 1 [Canis lupus familiaris]XP_038451857.1 retrotransposon-like protein 1 [Canis lupus familiaris]XP_038530587.1 retrotransposon-like protein 1 [Canis lupus familiaris]XP_038530588.1 retrotransposon-like protein 1 [Canis lupus familiaris]XP_048969453.1 LOW QUALITY PROTEIN: retrotransposon-like protein 1 [Canis lupus dingo]|eukprot:XP_003639272.1 retrotransposon-like protein 1 [Canis lupus familiaris]
MIEPSEDSFETMMERKNPSSKQMESSEGSSNTTVETSGSGAQEAAGPASGPAQGMKELPIDLRQDMEEPSSGPHREIKDPPNDLLQDLEESRNGSHQEVGDPSGEAPGTTEEASVNPRGARNKHGSDTDLASGREEEEQLEEEPETSEFMATVRSIISLYFRMQDLREQQRVAEEILMEAINAGRLPVPVNFSGDRREYHEFIVLCQLILQSYPSMFYNDRLRVGYIMCHLSGMALEWARALMNENSSLMSDFPAFLEAMSGMFEYRQAQRVAEDAMFNIRQGSRTAIEYINEFQGLVPTLGWSDEVLQAHLCQGLNEEIRHYLFRVPQPDSLESLIVLVLQIEEKLAERRAMLRLPPEARPRNLTWIDSPAPERWMVSSWLPCDARPAIDRNHLFLLLLVRVNPYHSVAVQALVDSGAGGNFMDERFAQEHYVELYEKPYPQMVQGVDGSLIGNEPVWLYTEPLVCIHQNHQESIEFDIVPSPNFSVILGIKWLRIHTPEVDWVRGRCTFHSPYCLQKCFRPPPPCIALERHAISLLPGLPPLYSDLADVFNPKEADDETSDQPSSDGSDDLSESEPSELQQAGDSDHSETFYECPSIAPWEPVGAGMQESARPRDDNWNAESMLTDKQDYIQIIPELFDQLHGATWFTKLELRGTIVEESMNIHQAEDVWKTAFGFELPKMKSYKPFPLSSDPVIPQNVLHFILKDMLGYFVLSYGQDVVVYSMSQEEHFQHVRQVLVRFRHHHVYCSLDRSQFHRHTVEFMGFVLTPKGVKLNKTIVTTVTGYPTPGSKKSLKHLLRFILPYQHFVERFSVIIEPLVRLLLNAPTFSWGDEEQEAFECLKRAFRKAPLLHHPKPQNPFYLETGVTKTALHASLIQIDEQTGKRVSCAFYSRIISPIEVAYSQLEMKILPIRASFMVWCRYLENTEEPIMILLNTEDLASLNNDRLTVLLPGHWVFFFSHFNFDVMERPAQEGGRPLPPVRNLTRRAFQHNTATRSRSLFTTGGYFGDRSLDSEEDDETEDASNQDEPNGRNLQQEFLALIPIDQIFHSFLAHFSVAQIRAVILHFFRGLLFWKDTLAVAALLVLLKLKRRLSMLPTPAWAAVRPPQRRWLRLGQAATLVPGSGTATAIAQLLTQVPPTVGTSAVPAQELAGLLLGPGHRQQRALLPLTRRGLQLTPGFWLLLCDFFGVRVGAWEGARPLPGGTRYLELHVVGDEDVVLREALQDDLQRYRQCGLHDGLQDTSQDEQENDVQEALSTDTPMVLQPLRHLPVPSEVLAFLSRHPPRVRSAYGQPDPVAQELAARALLRFLTTVYAQAPPAPIWAGQPRGEARLEELPDGEDNASLK